MCLENIRGEDYSEWLCLVAFESVDIQRFDPATVSTIAATQGKHSLTWTLSGQSTVDIIRKHRYRKGFQKSYSKTKPAE